MAVTANGIFCTDSERRCAVTVTSCNSSWPCVGVAASVESAVSAVVRAIAVLASAARLSAAHSPLWFFKAHSPLPHCTYSNLARTLDGYPRWDLFYQQAIFACRYRVDPGPL